MIIGQRFARAFDDAEEVGVVSVDGAGDLVRVFLSFEVPGFFGIGKDDVVLGDLDVAVGMGEPLLGEIVVGFVLVLHPKVGAAGEEEAAREGGEDHGREVEGVVSETVFDDGKAEDRYCECDDEDDDKGHNFGFCFLGVTVVNGYRSFWNNSDCMVG